MDLLQFLKFFETIYPVYATTERDYACRVCRVSGGSPGAVLQLDSGDNPAVKRHSTDRHGVLHLHNASGDAKANWLARKRPEPPPLAFDWRLSHNIH